MIPHGNLTRRPCGVTRPHQGNGLNLPTSSPVLKPSVRRPSGDKARHMRPPALLMGSQRLAWLPAHDRETNGGGERILRKNFYSAESLDQPRTSYIEVTTQEWSMTAFTAGKPLDREAFDRLLGELRPKLHRYCARMTGSVLDGEDVVHEAIVKAMEALSQPGPIARPE